MKIPRSALPNVIHPLTQEVLMVLEHYTRVSEILDHCSYPDYQVLRTLHTPREAPARANPHNIRGAQTTTAGPGGKDVSQH